jgi:hypothetical protein
VGTITLTTGRSRSPGVDSLLPRRTCPCGFGGGTGRGRSESWTA